MELGEDCAYIAQPGDLRRDFLGGLLQVVSVSRKHGGHEGMVDVVEDTNDLSEQFKPIIRDSRISQRTCQEASEKN
jgi:hypothetical protein